MKPIFEIDFELHIATDAQIGYINRLVHELHEKRGWNRDVPYRRMPWMALGRRP